MTKMVEENYINNALITNTKRFLFNKRKNQSAFIKRNSEDKREVTHRLLDGGNLHIGKDEMDQFYKVYATDIVSGYKNYIVELRTPLFKYFIDLDIFDHEYYTGKRLQKIIIAIQKVLSHFFNRSSINSDVYVCTTPERRVKKDELMYIKTGVHLIWPHVYVTQEIALFLRQFIIQYMTTKFGPRSEHNTWDDVVDESVYNQNGLRLLGSYKAIPCKVCKNKHDYRDSCESCAGLGKLFGEYTYKLEYILTNTKHLKPKACRDLCKQQSEMIKLLSIRTNKFKSNVTIEEPYPPWFDVSCASKTNKHISKILKTTRENQKRTGGANAVSVSNESIVTAITSAIRETFGEKEVYRGVGIKTIRRPLNAKTDCYWITTDCNYCLNVKREHTSSTIYFKLTYDGIVQKCFCKKNTLTGGREQFCGKFESKKYDYSLKYKEILFPEQYTKERQESPAYQMNQIRSRETTSNEMPSRKPISFDDIGDNDLFSIFR